jgi:hypothetical protein
MKKKDFDPIDKLAQDAFEHFEVPFDAGDWMDFQQQLNKESTIDQAAKDALYAYEVPLDPNGWEEFQQVQQQKKSGLLYIWWYKAAEAGIMALLLLGTIFNLPCSNKKSIHNHPFAYDSTSTLTTTSNNNSTNNNTNSFVGSITTTTGANHTTTSTSAAPSIGQQASSSTSAAHTASTKEPAKNLTATSTTKTATTTSNSATSATKPTGQNKPIATNKASTSSIANNSMAAATDESATTADNKTAMQPTVDYSNNRNNNVATNSNNTVDNSLNDNSDNATTTNQNNRHVANSNSTTVRNNKSVNTTSTKSKIPTTTANANSLEQLLAINSSTLQLATPASKNKTVEPITLLKPIKLQTPHICRHYLGATLGVGANMGTSMGKTSIGYTGGLTYEKEFSGKISLTVGLSSSYKRYDRSDLIRLDRSAIDGKIYEMTQVKTSNLVLLEIPVEVNYTCFRSDKWRIYANVGISANAIFSRTYTGSQQLQVDGLSISTELNSSDFERGLVEGGAAQQNLYLSVGGGVGVERKLDDNLSLYLLPTYRHGINSVHNDWIHTFNVNIGIKKALNK